jgi:hypothetical protein
MAETAAVYLPEREARYAAWLHEHPHGFVINAPKSGAQPMFWHRADCDTIQPYEDTRLVEGDYIKACSLDPGALAVWAVSRDRRLNYCQACRDRWLKEQRTATAR